LDFKTSCRTAGERGRLLQLALKGEQDALNRLLLYYMPQLYFAALRILGQPQDAEDAVQDGLLSAVQHLKSFQGRSRFSTWLTRIVINSALMQLRRRRQQPLMRSTDQELQAGDSCFSNEIVDFKPNPEEIYLQTERYHSVDLALQRLSALGRSALQLRFIEGLNTLEAAEALGISVATLKSAIYRSRVNLRTAYKIPRRARRVKGSGIILGEGALLTGGKKRPHRAACNFDTLE